MPVRASRVRRLRIRKAVKHATLVVGVVAAGSLYMALEKNVTLVVDGRPQAVRTLSGNVGQLLAVRGIKLDPGDLVEPPPATPLADGMTVTVDLGAGPLTDGIPSGVGVWVVEGAVGPFAKLAAQPAEIGVSAEAPVGPSRTVDARVVVMGKEHDVLTNAATVRDLLSAMGITPDGNDRVHPSPSTPLHVGQLVRFDRVDVRTREVVATIPYATVNLFSSKLTPGTIRVVRPGAVGHVLRTYRVVVVDGEIVSQTVVSAEVISRGTSERRIIGRQGRLTTPGGETGEASWYYAPGSGLTAAHPWLPYGTVVTVTNLDNGKSVSVVINDRGPFGGRIIDLSPEAFSAIAPLGQGVANVSITW